jgi:hypothetical protein
MRLSETRDLFTNVLTFPVERDTVVEKVGEVTLYAPHGDDDTIAEVLERSSQTEFVSIDDLYGTLVSNVSDAYIGRKGYDERSGLEKEGHEEVSF